VQQLCLDFPIKTKYFTEDFFISQANKKALEMLQQWPHWGNGFYSKIVIGSGKTHLSYIWQNLSGAKRLSKNDLHDFYFDNKALILENIETIDQESLLHLINVAQESQQYLLLNSSISPANLKLTLPDLRSRILSIPSVAIDSPDSDLLKAVLLKHLSDRNLQINAVAVDYIIPRIDRSFTKLIGLVNKLESFSKISKRSITIPLIKEALMH
jgi:chromosomal replication initiation ATPase DnaA